jgi:transposase-like protein
MQLKKQGRTPLYDNAFKVAVAREYLTGNSSYSFLAKKYDLPGAKTVNGFVRWYKKHYPEGAGQPQVKEQESARQAPDNDPLSKQLKEANLKIAGLKMLIETARKELGIDIVKKPGTKQS